MRHDSESDNTTATTAADGLGNPPDRKRNLSVPAREEFARWAEKYARFRRTSVAGLFDQAVTTLSKQDGFESPPRR